MNTSRERAARIVWEGAAALARFYATGYADGLHGIDRWKEIPKKMPEDGMSYSDGHADALAGRQNKADGVPPWTKLS